MEMICCGEVVDTPFCPKCGRDMSKSAGVTLLEYLELHRRNAETRLSNRKDPTSGYAPDNHKYTETQLNKWTQWVDWVRSAINEGH